MAEKRLEQLADDVRRLITALEAAVRERDALRRRLAELSDRAESATEEDGAERPAAAAASDDEDALMEHVISLESERAEIRERLTRLLHRLEEVDLDQ